MYEELLEKAKQKYKSCIIKIKEYENKLNDNFLEHFEYSYYEYRIKIYQAEINVLEELFGLKVLTEETIQKSIYSPYLMSLSNEIDSKIQELKDLEDKISNRTKNESK